jgi:phosphate-selective porin OprO/OprP
MRRRERSQLLRWGGFVACLLSAAAHAASEEAVVKTRGGLEIASMDGAFAFALGGRLMLDAARYQDDKTDLHSGSETRRARLEVEGVLHYDWEYEIAYDFADDATAVKDAWLGYGLSENSQLRIGNFKEPFSLEELTSSKYITFMERALPNAFAPGRRLGVGYFRHGRNWSLASGVFSEAVGDSGANDDAGHSVGLRLTYAPLNEGASAVHLGGAINFRHPGNDETVRFRARPESHVTDIRLVNTDKLTNVDGITLGGLEAAWVSGPLSLQGEYMRTRLTRRGSDDLVFSGYYALISWFVTGESRVYKAKSGAFKRIKPIAPSGAWEVALRTSHINLMDGAVAGGKETNATIGINWYANAQVRLMLNYIRVNTEPSENTALDVANPGGSDDPSIVQLRAQFDF